MTINLLNVDLPYTYVNGVVSYYADFKKIILPEIKRNFTIDLNSNNNFSFLSIPGKTTLVGDSKKKYVILLHNDIKSQIKEKNKIVETHSFITHYLKHMEWLKEYSFNSCFIPMSIDTEKLPINKNKNGKIIYFSNLTDTKEMNIRQVKNELGIDFDIISEDRFNNGSELNRKEIMEIVSEYEYGIGVGRSALEMLAMGLKVWVIGKNISGVIKDKIDLKNQWFTNMNSSLERSYSIKEEYELWKKCSLFNINIFDMRNFVNSYISFIVKTFKGIQNNGSLHKTV